jgi:hypothetical protein
MANIIKIIFFLVVVVGIGIYILSQSPKIFQGSPQEKVSAPSQTYISPSPAPNVSLPSPAQTIPDYLIPSGFTRSQLSPYFGKARVSAQYNSFYTYYPSQFTIYGGLSSGGKVDVTGWRIRTNHGEIVVPQAIGVYNPSGLSSQGDIILSANDYVNIYVGNSPIGKNFRLNKCTGYLANDYVFFPPLPQNCPASSRSDTSYLSGPCQNYINSLWGCKVPDKSSDSFYASIGGSSRDEVNCRAFLDTINQDGCFKKHRFDSDFFSNEWRAWINSYILDSQHDRVLLLDKQGLLVNEYTY